MLAGPSTTKVLGFYDLLPESVPEAGGVAVLPGVALHPSSSHSFPSSQVLR